MPQVFNETLIAPMQTLSELTQSLPATPERLGESERWWGLPMQSNYLPLKMKANALRRRVLEMCFHWGGHISTSFSCVEILVALYHGGVLKFDPASPKWPGRDRFILSKGHGETILYAVLADLGFFPDDWIETSYRHGPCRLGGHVDHRIPGVEATTGALGHGLGLAAGMAHASKLDGRSNRHVVLLGDAECSEGSVWEAALYAAGHGLDNLVAIVDRNQIGSLDYTRNYIALEPFAEKWESFGWAVSVVDGHDFSQLLDALSTGGEGGRPRLVMANTVKGRGVSAFEDDPIWHVRPVTADLMDQARLELQEPLP